VGGQQKNVLPVLPPNHTLARLYPEEAHKLDPSGVDTMITRSQASMWITRIRPTATDVKGACFACKRQAKELGSQRTAPLQAHKMGPAPPFWSMAVDLFRPLPIMGSMNKRTTGKAWGMIFVCTATYMTYVEIVESYSTPTGPVEVHGAALHPEAVLVRLRDSASCRFQASRYLGLVKSVPAGGQCGSMWSPPTASTSTVRRRGY
jgi:hypothetical protein